MWWGKALGAMIGLYRGGPFGMLLGMVVGHGIDQLLARMLRRSSGPATPQVHSQFFESTFQFMGHMAKAKGRVEEVDIAFARSVMTRIGLTPAQRERAVELFNQGKSPDFDRDEQLRQLTAWLAPHPSLLLLFLETLVQTAYANGRIDPAERVLLQRVCDALSVNRIQFEYIHRRVLAQRAWQTHQQSSAGPRRTQDMTLQEAYDVLGVKASDDDKTIKIAYRRLMSQHHPDKLMSQGLPDSMQKLAKEKVQGIQAAYSAIKVARKNAT
ncbi:co-chaperone DjlA [Salinispirillum sp. LH 10-3-1]|uniref:Co-chaperone DjlA n=1 Tax=Salinispirillum sp. LH 10-3-1 TaxID=2952525 RepID=A0AB38YJ22_9GAMM